MERTLADVIEWVGRRGDINETKIQKHFHFFWETHE